jgi:hypothetical protein
MCVCKSDVLYSVGGVQEPVTLLPPALPLLEPAIQSRAQLCRCSSCL